MSFVQDGFSRRILGFTVSTGKSSELVMRALEQAVSVRRRTDRRFVADGVIHHSDAGSQYTSLAFSQKLLDHGVNGSIGRVGTAYDNALMESTIGLFKSELIHARSTSWCSRQEGGDGDDAVGEVVQLSAVALFARLRQSRGLRDGVHSSAGHAQAGRVRAESPRNPVRFTGL